MDNLFKEKFKDFSETPDERVWENIEASLNKRKKKRIVPIWWQLGGAAAAIALLLYLINPFSSDENVTTPNVVNTEKKEPIKTKNDLENRDVDSNVFQESQNNQVAGSSASESTSDQKNGAQKKLSQENQQGRDVIASRKNVLNMDKGLATSAQKQNTSSEPQIAIAEDENPNGIPVNVDNAIAENSDVPKEENLENTSTLGQDDIAKTNKEAAVVAENEDKEEGTISIFDAIEEQKNLEDNALAENTAKRWSMGPSVAPVFFSSVGEGSPIHSNFASNSKSGNLNLSYGLTVTYNVSKKLSVRSGVHRVDFGYNTNDVIFTSSLTTSTNDLIDNINYSQTSRNLVVESKNNEVETFNANANAAIGGAAQPFEGRMVQQLGYVEVPMELNYALLDKKFGINLIGGVSSLFLIDNAISLESDQLITEVGEANNANDINFSTNIGIGFNYGITQKLELNVEPIFKYQLNTFSETAGNFRPYSVGVYSGLRFKF